MSKTPLKSIIFSWLENLLTMICFETYPLVDHIKDHVKIGSRSRLLFFLIVEKD